MIIELQYSLEQEIKIIQFSFMFLDHQVEDNNPSGIIIMKQKIVNDPHTSYKGRCLISRINQCHPSVP